jgi:hypothetical protein
MKYYYVFIPYEEELSYVWDADTADDPTPLGYTENYMEGEKMRLTGSSADRPARN